MVSDRVLLLLSYHMSVVEGEVVDLAFLEIFKTFNVLFVLFLTLWNRLTYIKFIFK